MATFKVSTDLREGQDGWLVISLDDADILQLHYGIPHQLSDRVTLFWRGIPGESHLQTFIRDAFHPDDELLGTLLLFPNAKAYLPPRAVETIPSEEETKTIGNFARGAYGVRFIRYDVFSKYAPSQSFENCRYAVWADFPPFGETHRETIENEIGVYAALHDFARDRLYTIVTRLLIDTVTPAIQSDDATMLLDYTLSKFRDAIVPFAGGRP